MLNPSAEAGLIKFQFHDGEYIFANLVMDMRVAGVCVGSDTKNIFESKYHK